MNSHPGVQQTLALVRRLGETLRDFAAREDAFNKDYRFRSGKLVRRHEEDTAAQDSTLTANTARAEADFQTEKQNLQTRFQKRAERIARARTSGRQHRMTEIEEQSSRRNVEIQHELLASDHTRDAALKLAGENYSTFTQLLAEEDGALAVLETRTHSAFRGYGKFRQLLSATPATAAPNADADENTLLADLRETLDKLQASLARFRRSPLPLLFRCVPLWILVPLILAIHAALVPVLRHFGGPSLTLVQASWSALAFAAAAFLLHFISQQLATPAAGQLTAALRRARHLHAACFDRNESHHTTELAHIGHEHQITTTHLNRQWRESEGEVARARIAWGEKIDAQAARILGRNEHSRHTRYEVLELEHRESLNEIKHLAAERRRELDATFVAKEKQLNVERDAQWHALLTEWNASTQSLHQSITTAGATAGAIFPEWDSPTWKNWTPPETFAHAAPFGRLAVDTATLAGNISADSKLTLPGASHFELPLTLTFPLEGSVLFETKDAGRDEVIAALNSIILRLLAVAPPGKVAFTIIDPVELGQDFASLMHLADYEERLINSRIWTQPAQIEQQLALLNEHIEKVTQMYLRNEYETIAEYNEQAGRIAEKYHFLVVADFPVNFTDTAVKRLMSIAASGARCGVYLLLHWNQSRPALAEFVPDELRKNSVCIQWKNSGFTIGGQAIEGAPLKLDAPPAPEQTTEFLQRVGKSSIDSNRVEMPFSEIAPAPEAIWSLDTTNELRVPVGRTGATKLQYLALGKGTRQHALIAGKTGSGKSTLFHVMITNLALWCSPDAVEFYLVDFKKGVEFKCYATARLPHARVVAIESDREFALSVLQRVDDELKRRGDLFRKLGVQDMAGYKREGGAEKIPRTLLIIDEFQEYFVADDRIAQDAALLLDRIVRQGRAFGIHVLLGSQTLGGAYTLARTTLGQMVVRIALQCNEADAYLIMDENNPAPRLLSRPGEAIYNDSAGTIEGNSPFQIVWLTDESRAAHLNQIRQRADAGGFAALETVVFEGNAPADLHENQPLQKLLAAPALQPASVPRVWLGAPNSIKGPTEAAFKRQSGNHLLIVGQRDEAALAMVASSLVALAAQHPRGAARFVVLDSSAPESSERALLEQVVRVIPHDITLARNTDIAELMTGFATELERRADATYAAKAPMTYLFVLGLQRFKSLRNEDDFDFALDAGKAAPKPGAVFNNLICEGASLGCHIICTCDTANNLNRNLNRKALSEFELRVLFQMSANDSAGLIDSAKAGDLGLYRAIFHNAQEGYQETFRPYALPSGDWLEAVGRDLARLRG